MAKSKTVSTSVLIEVTITTPNGETSSDIIEIKNASGCIPPSKINSSSDYIDAMREVLSKKYGRGHIK